MPGGDRTGPLGRGPMTGRGAGLCSGSTSPGYFNPGYGRRFNRWGSNFGRGFRGFGRRFWYREGYDISIPQPNMDEEKQYLENLVKSLESEIKEIKDRIQEISKEKDKTS